MEIDRRCRKCEQVIQQERPKQARYCKECGAKRTKDWKHEHPERTKLYDSDDCIQQWREQNYWNKYIRAWRKCHYYQYREQNRRHLQEYRKRKHQVSVAIVAILCILLATSEVFASSSETKILSTIEVLEQIIIRVTAILTLILVCLRILLSDTIHIVSNARRHQRKQLMKKASKKTKSNRDTDLEG